MAIAPKQTTEATTLYDDYDDRFNPEDKSEDFGENNVQPTITAPKAKHQGCDLPGHKTGKQRMNIFRAKTGNYSIYWKAALKLINAYDRGSTSYSGVLAHFNQVCRNFNVESVDHTWLRENLKNHEDCIKFKNKIRRELEKKQSIFSLRNLRC